MYKAHNYTWEIKEPNSSLYIQHKYFEWYAKCLKSVLNFSENNVSPPVFLYKFSDLLQVSDAKWKMTLRTVTETKKIHK